MNLKSVIAPSFYEVHKDIKQGLHTHYWENGGRGSTKSSFISIEIVQGMMKDAQKGIMSNAVALRKVKDTLHDSVFDQLVWAIDILGVSQYWNIPKTKLELTYIPTGQKIKFRGADKPKKIKSIKFPKGYCKYIWYEELDEFNGTEEIRMINQSLMRGGDKFIVFYSYNPPKSVNNWVNAEAMLTREDRVVHHSTYLSVPQDWLGKQFLAEAEHLKKTKPTNYEHEYLGKITGTGGEIFCNVICRPITEEEIAEFTNIRRGIDYGYAIDPFSYGVMHYDRKYRRLYIFHEIYQIRLSNYKAAQEIKKENKENAMITADSAEPKSIAEMRQYGLKIKPVKKGPDSVDYGIKFLSEHIEAIIIDDQRCPNTAREFINYELEKDANGNFKAEYPDKDNHSIDMTRYALDDDIKAYKEKLKKPADTDNPSKEENYQKMVKKVTGGKVNVKIF
jgi:phage terminase large subunit